MPTWSNAVPTDPRGQGLPLLRTPAGRTLTAVVTSTDLIGCNTHFWGGHTMPCEAPECEACQAGVAYRWHGYLAAFNPADQLHFIFEMTAQAAQTFINYRNEHKTIRCCQFQAYRWQQKRNGRVILKCEPSAIVPSALPRAPDLGKIMAIIWRLPIPNVTIDGIERGVSRVFADSEGNGRSSDPRDYKTPQP